MSPDWAAQAEPVPYAKMDDPQSLNLYSYVRNNPLTRTDPDGHCCEATWNDVQTGLEVAAATVGAAEVAAVAAGAAGVAAIGGAAYSISQGNSPYATPYGTPTTVNLSLDSSKAPPNPNGSKGAPDHQATVAEEAAKIGGKTEVRIPTPGGAKQTRVGDAVATDASGKVTAVTQVIRPTAGGNVPKRETQAAKDIQSATGVKPNLVPVRPLPKP